MSRALRVSGFLGLTVMMSVGMYQNYLNATAQGVPAWMIGGHAHLGVLSIIAIVLSFAVSAVVVDELIERIVTWAFILGQWGLPLVPWLGVGAGIEILHPTGFLWGALLILSMVVMAWQSAIQPGSVENRSDPGLASADD